MSGRSLRRRRVYTAAQPITAQTTVQIRRSGHIVRKSYLNNQIRLISLSTSDLFTEEEYAAFSEMCSCSNELNIKENDATKSGRKLSEEEREPLLRRKREQQARLASLLESNENITRSVRLSGVIDTRKCRDENGEVHLPAGVTWRTLRASRKIAEFSSEESRAMGLSDRQITFDKIIVKWRSVDLLRQITMNGFNMDILQPDGSVVTKHYSVITASAGQLRTNRVQCVSDEMWEHIKVRLECGLDWDAINQKGGVNVAKYMAYLALSCSATDPWPEMDIDRCIVIPDFEAPVRGTMKKINPDYSSEVGEYEVMINHFDGAGVMLPSVSKRNFMTRGPWLKGLLTPFDFIKFCKVHKVPPLIKDVWGLEHDLVKENIQIMFTASQLKLWKYYESWEAYKTFFRFCGCTLSRTNYEEAYIPDTEINYQMLQTLQDFTDEEIEKFTLRSRKRIDDLCNTKESMLSTLGADINSTIPFKRALALYPSLLRDGYCRESLRSIKKRWTLDGRSGRLLCRNKRLFAIPDAYAACQFWFLHQERPEGLLQDGVVACRPYEKREKLDVLRSPHLYMEHAVRRVSHDPEVYEWLCSNGIYTSCHDLISRILQFDCDGDQLNVVEDELLITIAERNIEKYHIIPLFYDAMKAPPETLSRENLFAALKRAHDYSGIGQVSNALTKLWNKPDPDLDAAAWLTYYNNQVIDAAKTGKINDYENYPEIAARISKATGGKSGAMPYFFQFSMNARRSTQDGEIRKTLKMNDSTLNRICRQFMKRTYLNQNPDEIPPFSWRMLAAREPGPINPEMIELFCLLDSANVSTLIEAKSIEDTGDRMNGSGILAENMVEELEAAFGSLEAVYPSVLKYLFAGEGERKASHKQMFWKVFGYIALRNLEDNLVTAKPCPKCGQMIPSWHNKHNCGNAAGFITCCDCGTLTERRNSRQCRCPSCQAMYTQAKTKARVTAYRSRSAA